MAGSRSISVAGKIETLVAVVIIATLQALI